MNYLHYELDLGSDELVEVDLDKQANVRLMDEPNFTLYKRGQRHRYFGGLATQSPLHLKAPHPGRWHLVVDLGGFAGQVKAAVKTLKNVPQEV